MGNIINEVAVILDDNDSIERNDKEIEYLSYIKDHINNVRKAYMMYILPLLKKNNISKFFSDEEFKKAAVDVYKRLGDHDASKFSDYEFDGYRAKWYPTNREMNYDQDYLDKMEERYAEAWDHHATHNPHHPKYWYDPANNVSKDMDLSAIIEMICDWVAMGTFYGTSTLLWYENQAEEEKQYISPRSKEILEDLLYNVIFGSQEASTPAMPEKFEENKSLRK